MVYIEKNQKFFLNFFLKQHFLKINYNNKKLNEI